MLKQLAMQLHSLPSGEPIALSSVPWPVVTAYTRQWCIWYSLTIVPAQALYFLSGMRLFFGYPPLLYDTLFYIVSLVDATICFSVEVQVMRATGALFVWPHTPSAIISGICFSALFASGPFTKAWLVATYMTVRAFFTYACVVVYKPGLLLTRASIPYHVQAVGLFYAIMVAWQRNAKVRADFEAERRAALAKKKA